MKKVLLFLVIVLLSSKITFSKDFLQKLKDIKTISYEIRATKKFIKNDIFKDRKIFYLNLKHTKKKRNQLILSLLPFFKGNQAIEILNTIRLSNDNWCYKETVDTLLEYSFNLDNNEELNRNLLDLKNNITNFQNRDLQKRYWNDGWTAIEYFAQRDYENAILYIEKTIPQAEAALQEMLDDPETSPDNIISVKMEIKYFYDILATSYAYIIPPGTADKYEYEKAREAAHSAMNKYPEVFEAAEINSYGLISRTYLFEKDVFNAEKYYELYKQTAELLGGEELVEIGKTLEIEIMILKKQFDNALTIINSFISSYTPYPEYPKLGFIMAYYNRAVINADKSEFDKVKEDLQKCKEYINEPIDPDNLLPFVQDEVEYYKRLTEDFIIISFWNKNDSELLSPIVSFKEEYLEINRGKPELDVEKDFVHISIDDNIMQLIYCFEENTEEMTFTQLYKDENNPNIFFNDSGEKVTILSNPLPSFRNEDDKTFQIETIYNIKTVTLPSYGITKKYYSNLWKGHSQNITANIPDDVFFKIKIICLGIDDSVNNLILNYKTDYYTDGNNLPNIKFTREKTNIFVSEVLMIRKKTDDIEKKLIYYKTNPTITIIYKNNKIKLNATKGALFLSRHDMKETWINDISTAISKLGYSVVEDLSPTIEEFKKDIPNAQILYLNSHGAYNNKYVGISSYNAENKEDPRDWYWKLDDFNDVNANYEFVYFDACGSLNDDIEKIIMKFNPKAWIGWTFSFYQYQQGNLPKIFFDHCQNMSVEEALNKAKEEYISDPVWPLSIQEEKEIRDELQLHGNKKLNLNNHVKN